MRILNSKCKLFLRSSAKVGCVNCENYRNIYITQNVPLDMWNTILRTLLIQSRSESEKIQKLKKKLKKKQLKLFRWTRRRQ